MTATVSGTQPVLWARDVTKSFGALVANDVVQLEVFPGEIHAVVGENGAGKTTLMRILSGEILPDSGTVQINGEEVRLRGPQDAVRRGIGMVHQHYSVVPGFSVLDNLLLGVPGGSARALSKQERQRAIDFLVAEGFAKPADALIQDFAVDEVQRFEIVKLLYVGAKILILDEPTAVLGPIEVEKLYERLRALAGEGHAIVVITHKLGEVETYADRVTVMRGGRTVLTTGPRPSRSQLLTAMFGEHVAVAAEQESTGHETVVRADARVALTVSDFSVVDPDGRARVSDVSFTVREGETLCVIGVEGNGQSHLMDALAGLRPSTGRVAVLDRDISGLDPRDRFEQGLRFVSEDRLRWDVIKDATVSENLLAHDFASGRSLGFTDARGKTVVELVTDALRKFDVRPVAPRMRLGNLSGGNQQRAVVARESGGPKTVLLLSHPTRGLDVVGSATIVQDVRDQLAQGVAVVWNTADIDEAFLVGDHILVLFQGRVALLGSRATTPREQVALAMSGAGGELR